MHPANGSLILKEESWPAEARWILTEFLMSDEGAQRGNVTPRFIIAQNQKIVLTATGNGGWKDTIWPRIQEMTGTRT
ncbi:hypothetical protein [Reyranella sp. CPCC 100927]|uniref:hypothetical protein n=1 Tax=Reyranella sp. CPCC 100927 TaxID=2599616 RepID=UPI0011B72E90|nr:hypothetical protein [Reyranella sp. CPCC 100927]TWS95820.1 hypothetical protein FQU96_40110 [Reyranella sp. CPCC 100927]